MANMNEDREIINPEKKNVEEEHEINLQYHFYLPFFAIIYLGSYFLPGIIFMLYLFLVFKPFFLENNDFLSLFIDFNSLLALVLMPLIVIGCYLLHLFFALLMDALNYIEHQVELLNEKQYQYLS